MSASNSNEFWMEVLKKKRRPTKKVTKKCIHLQSQEERETEREREKE